MSENDRSQRVMTSWMVCNHIRDYHETIRRDLCHDRGRAPRRGALEWDNAVANWLAQPEKRAFE